MRNTDHRRGTEEGGGCAGPAVRFDSNPYAGAHETNAAPPTLGQHDTSVREWLDDLA